MADDIIYRLDAAATETLTRFEFNHFDCAAHSKGRITLLSCGTDSTAALRNIANAVNATLPCGKVAVVGGTALMFKAPGGMVISMQ